MKNNVLGLSASAFFYNFVGRIKMLEIHETTIFRNGNEKMFFDFSLLDCSCHEVSGNGRNCGR